MSTVLQVTCKDSLRNVSAGTPRALGMQLDEGYKISLIHDRYVVFH